MQLREAGRAFLLSLLPPLAQLGIAAGLGLVLAVQWGHAVPGNPGWLLLVPAANVALFSSRGGCSAAHISRSRGMRLISRCAEIPDVVEPSGRRRERAPRAAS